jgi:hypothetical protein
MVTSGDDWMPSPFPRHATKGAAMLWQWWDSLGLGEPGVPSIPTAEHLEHSPFCGRYFDRRDLGQVLEHYDHQLAADAPPAIELTPEEDKQPDQCKVIPFYRSRRKKS